ncbi:MAG: glycerol-3-phosphate responsive antiterminator [Hespellia sp.]|nr:glycerol-3-phosphate responsive antiterminator [Hespellia sp.]
MKEMMEWFEDNPVILGISTESDIELAAKNEAKIVFTLYGDIAEISSIVDRLKNANKTVFVNIDMVDGFSGKNSVLKFMKQNTRADGIISSKASMLRYAKELGFFTIHRFFVLDSASYRNIGKQLEISRADFINIVPGWTKVIQWAVEEHNKPVIAAGLVCDKKAVIDSLKAGAIAICSTNHEVWKL